MWRFKNLTCVARGPIDTRMARSANAKGACAPCQFHPRSASIKPVTFIVENGTVRMVNSAVYAMQMIQAEIAGEGERTGLTSEADVSAAVKAMRDEGEYRCSY